MNKKSKPTAQQGFTLIEITIVLVVVGLVVASIFVGRALIESAVMRKLVSQKQSFDIAASNFFLQYDCFPGDCNNASGLQIGNENGNENGNGNGKFDGSSEGPPSPANRGELLNFWTHLSNARLITDAINASDYKLGSATPVVKVPAGYSLAESCENGGRGGWGVATDQLVLNGGTAALSPDDLKGKKYVIACTWENINATDYMTPNLAFLIDSKIDDSLPLEGDVRAAPHSMASSSSPLAPQNILQDPFNGSANDVCVKTNVTPNSYNLSFVPSFSRKYPCALVIKANF